MSAEPKFRALVVDDEPPARLRLRGFLRAEPDFELVGECGSGAQAVEAIQAERPDVVFLDVQMPRLSGFEVCGAVGVDRMPLVVFVTAYDEYALRAFEVHAVDYLLKPFDQARFQRALQQVRRRLSASGGIPWRDQLKAMVEELRGVPAGPEMWAVRSGGRVVFVSLEELDWVEAEGNYVRLHLGTQHHLVRETLGWCEQRLPAQRFLRISRSALVNLSHVREMQPLFYGEYAVILRNGTRLTLSRNYRDRVRGLIEGSA